MIRRKNIIAFLMFIDGAWCFQRPTNVPSSFGCSHRTISTRWATGLESSAPDTNTNETSLNAPSSASSTEEEATKSLPTTTCNDCGPCAYIEKPSYADGTKPESALFLGSKNFVRQGKSMVEEGLAQLGIFAKDYIPPGERPPNCLGFTLDDQAVRDAERIRESKVGGKVETNPIARKLYETGCWALDELFPGRPIARFWFLETIARMPYFSYVSMLHLYESFGWWRDPELRKVHNAQEYNELHHLLIMEALGGNALWRDRFLGAHVAIGYYWALCALFLVSPKAAYEFMALLESHAVDTYTTFFHENADRLKMLPAPAVAMSYYKGGDLYLFDDFQVSKKPKTRRPPCDSLYDVFKNISEDEAEHVKTMRACMDYSLLGDAVVSPHLNSDADGSITEEKRQAWLDWTEEVNRACTAEEDF